MGTFACVDWNHIRNDAYLVKILLIYLSHLRIMLCFFNILASIIYAVCDKLILLERKKSTAKSSRIPHATSCGETEAWC